MVHKLGFRFTIYSFFLMSTLLSISALACGPPLTPLIPHLHSPLLLLQPTPFLHPEYNARIRGISKSMSIRSEHHRSYSFSGLSPLPVLHLSHCPVLPSILSFLCHLISVLYHWNTWINYCKFKEDFISKPGQSLNSTWLLHFY